MATGKKKIERLERMQRKYPNFGTGKKDPKKVYLGVKKTTRLPYLQRGRRVRFGQCKTCNNFLPKKHTYYKKWVVTKAGDKEEQYYTKVIVECSMHGTTDIEELVGRVKCKL